MKKIYAALAMALWLAPAPAHAAPAAPWDANCSYSTFSPQMAVLVITDTSGQGRSYVSYFLFTSPTPLEQCINAIKTECINFENIRPRVSMIAHGDTFDGTALVRCPFRSVPKNIGPLTAVGPETMPPLNGDGSRSGHR